MATSDVRFPISIQQVLILMQINSSTPNFMWLNPTIMPITAISGGTSNVQTCLANFRYAKGGRGFGGGCSKVEIMGEGDALTGALLFFGDECFAVSNTVSYSLATGTTATNYNLTNTVVGTTAAFWVFLSYIRGSSNQTSYWFLGDKHSLKELSEEVHGGLVEVPNTIVDSSEEAPTRRRIIRRNDKSTLV